VGFLQVVAVQGGQFDPVTGAIINGVVPGIGPAIALAPLIGTIACIFTAVSVASLAIKYAFSGGIYAYTREALGPAVAFMTGWTILLPYLLLPAAGALFIGVYMPVLTSLAGISFAGIYEGLIWALIFGLIMTVMAFIGIVASARAMTVILLVQLVLVLVIAFAAIFRATTIPGTDWIAPLNPGLAPGGMGALAAAGFTFFFAFYGFEATTTFGGDAKNPYKSCALGALMAIGIVGTLYVFLGWALSVPYTSSGESWLAYIGRLFLRADMTPVAEDMFGVTGIVMLAVAIVISALGSGVAASCAVSRILYSMGNDRLLPQGLGKLHKKFNSPYIAAIVVGVVTALIPIIFQFAGYTMLSAFVFFGLWCAWGALVMYMIVNIDAIVIFRHESTKSAKGLLLKLILPIIGFCIMAYIWYGSSIATVLLGPWPVAVLLLGIAWEIPGIIWLAYLYMKKPEIVKVGMRGM
jgi:amino acid transporter